MTKKTPSARLVEQIVAQSIKENEAKLEEQAGGPPSPETQADLDQDSLERPLTDADIFGLAENLYVKKGDWVNFQLYKDGKMFTTVEYPYSWDKLQKEFGGGHYTVKMRSIARGVFLKQETQTLTDDPHAKEEAPGLLFGAQTESKSELSLLLGLMQSQNERQENQRREDRERDEARRREDRDRNKDLFGLLIPALAPLLGTFLGPKDDKSTSLMLDFQRENQRNFQDLVKDMMARMEKASEKPKDTGPSAMELLRLDRDAEQRGWDKHSKISEEIEAKAEARAAEMAESASEEGDSVTTTLIKSLAPAIGAALSQKQPPAASLQPPAGSLPINVPAEVQAAVPAPEVPQSQDEAERAAIIGVVIPVLTDCLTKIGAGHQINPANAAKEHLQLLREKGCSQRRVSQLFTRDVFFTLVAQAGLPKELDPWFNEYYAALNATPKPAQPDQRSRGRVQSGAVGIQRSSGTSTAKASDAGLGNSRKPGDTPSSPNGAAGPVVLPPEHQPGTPTGERTEVASPALN